jgi:hypothetical protein
MLDAASRVAVYAGEAMRRTSWIIVGPLMCAVLAGCSDTVVSPTEGPGAAAPAPVRLAPEGRPALELSGSVPDSAAVDFTVGPAGGVFFVGSNAVFFPARSVCDPATSSYGPDTWDAPCTALGSTLRVHAEVRRRDGRTWVDFKPSLRFVPSNEPSRWVWLYMRTPEVIGATGDLSRFNIRWAAAIGGATVDEAPLDASLRTYVDNGQGISIRRIKHFSGYTASSGRSCDFDCPSGDPPAP